MQVAHRDDHITHAVISKAKPIELQMAQSAEFFQVLFKSLYKYPTVAMVRETICNAWDAHIEAGKTDVPIELMLNHEEFVIRDYGQGIPEEDMAIRYCVMGGSTKAKDMNVTGGFGLGCKAPFAVTDHFEVTSMSDGRKTIYNLSRSAGVVEGVPACIPIVTVPTTETGLQVKIPLSIAYRDLEQTIRRVVYGGGVLAKLNGELLERLPLQHAPGSWVIARKPVLAFQSTNSNIDINIRYGNVVYPGRDLESYLPDAYREVHDFLTKLHRFLGEHHSSRVVLVVQAQPGTLSVTPSRETLSMVPKTVEEIKQLFAVVHAKLIQDTIPVAFEAVQETVQSAVAMRDVRALTCVHHVPPHKTASTTHQSGRYYANTSHQIQTSQHLGLHLTSVAQLGKTLIHSPQYYSGTKGLVRSDITARLNLMLKEKLLDPGSIQTFRKTLSKGKVSSKVLHQWFKRKILMRLHNAMMKHPHLDHTKLFVPREQPYNEKGELIPAKAWSSNNSSALHYMAFLRKIVILGHSKEVICYNIDRLPDGDTIGGYSDKCLAYVVPREEKCIDAAKILFERHGYVIIDMTKTQEWMHLPPRYEKEINKAPRVRKPVKPKKGFVPLVSLLDREHGNPILRAIKSKEEVTDRVISPKGVLQLERELFGEYRFRIKRFSQKASVEAARLYGREIGVVANSTSLEVSRKKKALPPGERYILDQLLDEMTNNTRIRSYLSLHAEETHNFKMISYDDGDALVRALIRHPPAMKYLGMKVSMTPRDWDVLRLWNSLVGERRFDFEEFYPELKLCPITALNKKLKAIPIDQKMKDLIEWISVTNSWKMLDVKRISSTMSIPSTSDKGKAEQKLAGQLLMSVLKGK